MATDVRRFGTAQFPLGVRCRHVELAVRRKSLTKVRACTLRITEARVQAAQAPMAVSHERPLRREANFIGSI